MDKRAVGAITTLAAVTVLFLGAVHVTMPAKRFENKNPINGKEKALNTEGVENIDKAVAVLSEDGTVKGYIVTVEEQGYGGKIVMDITFDKEISKVLGMHVKQQSETENLGARIAEEEFGGQFINAELPVLLSGMRKDTPRAELGAAWKQLRDGRYYAEAKEEQNGYTDQLELTVEDGRVTAIVWDSVDADGNRKSVLSEKGQYVMTEDGLTWKEQAEALAQAVIENQDTEFLTPDGQGKTDAVAGVSISIGGFVNLLEEALLEAAGISNETAEPAAPEQGTAIDGISGATISSTAAVNGVNHAMEFLKEMK